MLTLPSLLSLLCSLSRSLEVRKPSLPSRASPAWLYLRVPQDLRRVTAASCTPDQLRRTGSPVWASDPRRGIVYFSSLTRPGTRWCRASLLGFSQFSVPSSPPQPLLSDHGTCHLGDDKDTVTGTSPPSGPDRPSAGFPPFVARTIFLKWLAELVPAFPSLPPFLSRFPKHPR